MSTDTNQPAPNWDRLQDQLNRDLSAELGYSVGPYQCCRAVQNIHDRLTALESTATPQPQPEPPALGVTVEELAEIFHRCEVGSPLKCARLAEALFDHPDLSPLLRGEGVPVDLGDAMEERWRDGWYTGHAAARAELARQQEVG